MDNSWRYEIAAVANQRLQENTWNKKKPLPTPADVEKLRQFIYSKIKENLEELKSDPKNRSAFKILTNAIYVWVVFFNRRRPGEVQFITKAKYEENVILADSECHLTLSEDEKGLLKAFRRITVRGKRGRPVPVLFNQYVQYGLRVLLENRKTFVVSENEYLFAAANGTTDSIDGSLIFRKFGENCGAAVPRTLTPTNLRKHVASNTQLLEMTLGDRRHLSDFMGHTENVHNNFYRLPDEVFQGARISKLLLLMLKGETHKYAGKTLNEIDVVGDLDISSDEEEEDGNVTTERKNAELENTRDVNESEVNEHIIEQTKKKTKESSSSKTKKTPTSTIKIKTKQDPTKKIVRQRWTAEEKEAALEYFSSQIKKKKITNTERM